VHPARPTSRLILIYGVGMLAYSVLTSILALYLGAEFGTNEHTIGKWFFYIGTIQVVMRIFLLGPIVDRIGEAWAMRAGTAILVFGLLLFPVPNTALLLALIVPCVPIGTALLFPSTTALVSRHVSRSEYGTVMGVAQTFAGIARIMGPMLATAAFQRIGHPAPFFIAGGIVALVGLLAFQVEVEPPTVKAVPAPAPETPA